MRYQSHDGDWLVRTSDNLVLGHAALQVHRRGYSSTIQAEGCGGFSHAVQRLANRQPPRRAAQDDRSCDLAPEAGRLHARAERRLHPFHSGGESVGACTGDGAFFLPKS